MAETLRTSITLPKTLHQQVQAVAERLHISRNQVVRMALEQFISRYPDSTMVEEQHPLDEGRLAIHQGDIYWVRLANPADTEASIPHPHVIIQDDLLNHSRIPTIVTCALTSNLERARLPGNVLLDMGEADLPKQSVVEVSKVSTIAKTQLGAYIGTLSDQRVSQILAGMQFLQRAFFTPHQDR